MMSFHSVMHCIVIIAILRKSRSGGAAALRTVIRKSVELALRHRRSFDMPRAKILPFAVRRARGAVVNWKNDGPRTGATAARARFIT